MHWLAHGAVIFANETLARSCKFPTSVKRGGQREPTQDTSAGYLGVAARIAGAFIFAMQAGTLALAALGIDYPVRNVYRAAVHHWCLHMPWVCAGC